MTDIDTVDEVAVVLCSYQGERFLSQQLDSIQRQSRAVSVYVHDDASSDQTVAIAQAHPATCDVFVRDSNLGFIKNFELGLSHACNAGYARIAFADQDDIWDAEKIERGLDALESIERVHGSSCPALVHSDLRPINAAGSVIQDSYFKARGYVMDDQRDVPRILGQNGVMGNTILMNRALADLALPFPDGLHMHDWWLAVLAELFGQRRCLMPPTISYRMHSANTSNSIECAQAHGLGNRIRQFPARLRTRDFRLPYKEDSRIEVVRRLLSGLPGLPPLSSAQKSEIGQFLKYLELEGRRWQLFRSSAAAGFFPGSPLRRLRIALALMLSKRYNER